MHGPSSDLISRSDRVDATKDDLDRFGVPRQLVASSQTTPSIIPPRCFQPDSAYLVAERGAEVYY
jgi:hypothetical protein